MDRDRDEERLQRLFDRTSAEPDGVQLTKLKARAVDVPARARTRPWGRIWAPLAAALALALVIFVVRSRESRAPEATALSADPTLHEQVPASATPLASAAPSWVAEPSERDELSDDSLGDFDSDLDAPVAGLSSLADDTEDWLAPLDAPADEEGDVWLSAAGAFLEDGG